MQITASPINMYMLDVGTNSTHGEKVPPWEFHLRVLDGDD